MKLDPKEFKTFKVVSKKTESTKEYYAVIGNSSNVYLVDTYEEAVTIAGKLRLTGKSSDVTVTALFLEGVK